MPCDYSKYPNNWKTEIRPRILKRADNKCEFCGVENYAVGFRDEHGKFWNCDSDCEQMTSDLDGEKLITIVLTISHQDHDIKNNCDSNLKALCQKCHLNHDKDHHRQTRLKKKYKNQPELGI